MRLKNILLVCIVLFTKVGVAQTADTEYYDYHRYSYMIDTVTLDEVSPNSKKIYKLLDAYIQDFSLYEDYKDRPVVVIDIDGGNANFVDFSFNTSYVEYELQRPISLLYGCFYYKNKLVIVYIWKELPISISQLFKQTEKKCQFIFNPEYPPEDDSLYPGKRGWEYRIEHGKIRQLKYNSNYQIFNE